MDFSRPLPTIHPVVYGNGTLYRAYSNTADKQHVIQIALENDGVPIDINKAWEFFINNHALASLYGVLEIVVDTRVVEDFTKHLIGLERTYKNVTPDSALRHALRHDIIQLRTELGLGMGRYATDEPSHTPLPQRELVTYDDPDLDDYEVRRTDSCGRASYREEQIPEEKCSGCQELDEGTGGENQMAHMYPGGCLHEEFEEPVSRTLSSVDPKYQVMDEGSTTPALWDFVEGKGFSR